VSAAPIRPWILLAGPLAAALLLARCTSSHRPPAATSAALESVGLYRGSLEDASGHASRFRLLLFAALPDRLHAEVLPPVGTPRLILDGGGGRLAISVLRTRVAYVGDAGAEAVRRAIGAPISLSALVRSIVLGENPDAPGVTVAREPDDPQGFAETFEVRWEGSSLRLELVRKQPLRNPGPGLGSGAPPEGFAVRSLEQIGEGEAPLLLEAEQ